jgi:hypothetical protein
MVERSTYAHLTNAAKLEPRKRPEANSFKAMVEHHLIEAKTVETHFTRSRPHTRHANHSVYHQFQSNQAPSKGCLTCAFTWSGRRDSNPRPSPWQREDDRPPSPPTANTCPPVHDLSTKYAPVHPVRRAVYVRVLTIDRRATTLESRSILSTTRLLRNPSTVVGSG